MSVIFQRLNRHGQQPPGYSNVEPVEHRDYLVRKFFSEDEVERMLAAVRAERPAPVQVHPPKVEPQPAEASRPGRLRRFWRWFMAAPVPPETDSDLDWWRHK